jgi:CRP-like cAMP-binding protein
MGPGEVFGEIAVILSEPRTATVEALDDVTVQVVGREELEKGLEFHPWLGKIVHALTERFRDVDARLTREEKP